jgi:hypothetical protein
MRPDRLMLKARRVRDGKWEPVGWLNIDKKDVEQLECLNGVESIGFENVAEQVSKQPNMYRVALRSKPVKNQNLSRGISL